MISLTLSPLIAIALITVASLITMGEEYTEPVDFVGSVPSRVYLIWSAASCVRVTVEPFVTSPATGENVGAATTSSAK